MPKMLQHWVFLLSSLCFLALPLTAFGDTPLTWEDCVQEASQHNPDLLAAQDTVQKSKYDVGASRSDFFPKLTPTTGYNTGNSNNFNTTANSSNPGLNVNVGNKQQLQIGAAFNQNIFAGYKNVGAYQRSKALLEDAEANLDAVKSQVSLDLKTDFARLLFFQEQMGVVKQIVERRSENVRFIKLRYQGGQEDKGSALRNQALLDQASYEAVQTERQLHVAQRALAKVLGRSTLGDYAGLQVKGNFKTLLPEKTPDFDALIAENPDHRRAEAQLKAGRADVRTTKGDLYPSLDASASVSRQKLNDNPVNNIWSAGVNLSYPFFLGGKDIYEWRGAKVETARLESVLKTTDDQVALQLKQSFSDFKDSVENIKVQQGFLQAAEVRAEIARSQYANGLLSYQDWDLIENDLINNQNTILSSLRDALIAEGAWEKAQGKGAIP